MATLTDQEKKTAVLVALVKEGVVDLNTLADDVVKRLPPDFDPNNPPQIGGSGAGFIGPWFAIGVVNT
jgi:hypothetical protein